VDACEGRIVEPTGHTVTALTLALLAVLSLRTAPPGAFPRPRRYQTPDDRSRMGGAFLEKLCGEWPNAAPGGNQDAFFS